MSNTRLILGVVSILFVLGFTLGYAEEEKAYVPNDNEEIWGTWVNTEYKQWEKWIFSPDGTCEQYNLESSPSPGFEGTYNITEKWTDSEGNIWYKVKATGKFAGEHAEWYDLARISRSGKTLEYVYHPVDYHKELDPKHPSYRVYYRK